MPHQKSKLLLPVAFILLLFAGFACRPSMDTLLKRARISAKDAPPRRVDTTVIILPALLLFKEDAAAHNATSFNIICLDNQGVFTDELDKMERCECQLYQQDEVGIKRMRVLWAAEPLDEWTWRRTYFDENGKPETEDQLKITAPYKFVFINNKTTWGDNYTHEEYTMYFEMTVIRQRGSRI